MLLRLGSSDSMGEFDRWYHMSYSEPLLKVAVTAASVQLLPAVLESFGGVGEIVGEGGSERAFKSI